MSTVTSRERRATRGGDTNTSTASIARIFLVLDATVLEPDLDLFLGEAEGRRDLDSTQPGEVHAGSELVLETQ